MMLCSHLFQLKQIVYIICGLDFYRVNLELSAIITSYINFHHTKLIFHTAWEQANRDD